MATFTVFEPLIMLVLEVFSLIFVGHRYEGVITEEQFPYAGISCVESAIAARWCGRYSYYSERLEAAESGRAYKNSSMLWSERRLDQVTLSVGTARRLSELQEEADFLVPAFDISDATEALEEASVIFVVLSSAFFAVFFSVLWDVFQSSAVLLFDVFFLVLSSLAEVLKLLVKSGLLTSIVNIGVDFVIILFTKLMIPMLFAAVDSVVCLIDLFMPRGCAARTTSSHTTTR